MFLRCRSLRGQLFKVCIVCKDTNGWTQGIYKRQLIDAEGKRIEEAQAKEQAELLQAVSKVGQTVMSHYLTALS